MQFGTTMDQVICNDCHRPLEAEQRIVWHDDAFHHEACAAEAFVKVNLAITAYTYYRDERSMSWKRHRDGIAIATCHNFLPLPL